MPQPNSQKKQLQILIALLVAFAAMTAFSFKDRIDLPTEQSLARLRRRVMARQEELQNATREANAYKQQLEQARRKLSTLKYNPALEREAINKLDRILDDSNITKSRSSVSANHGRGKTNLQQVTISLDFEDVSMRKLTDLFETFGMKSLGDKTPLYWTRFTITPRIVRRRNTPLGSSRPLDGRPAFTESRQLNVSATVSSFTLFPNASDLVFSEKLPQETTKRSSGRKGGRP